MPTQTILVIRPAGVLRKAAPRKPFLTATTTAPETATCIAVCVPVRSELSKKSLRSSLVDGFSRPFRRFQARLARILVPCIPTAIQAPSTACLPICLAISIRLVSFQSYWRASASCWAFFCNSFAFSLESGWEDTPSASITSVLLTTSAPCPSGTSACWSL